MNLDQTRPAVFQIATLSFVVLIAAPARGQDEPPAGALAFQPPDRATLEARFAEQLSGATLVGQFTEDLGDDEEPVIRGADKYTLTEVRKLRDNLWLFQTRIQYHNNDITLPITLPVEWAGDVPVIIVENVGFPGLGTYSARVAFHGDRYVGTWQGANHGGHMFGKIEKPEVDEERTGEE